MSYHLWTDLPASAFARFDTARTVAILPTAAVEQHGPHLPVGTDTLIAEGMLAEARPLVPDALDVVQLPVQAVGKSNEHLWARGTLTFTAETALKAWVEIGLSVARAGLRKIVIVNSHGGNLDLISILSRELRVQAGMIAVKCQWGSFGHPDGLFPPEEFAYGIHGGDVETSLMLHFRPRTVDMGQARMFTSRAETAPVPPIGPVSLGWVAKDLNPAGVVGNAAAATAEKGAAVAAHQAAGFATLLQTVADMPLGDYAPTPGPDS
ncbi:MAG: creatininase family protein [Rubricella sp.]